MTNRPQPPLPSPGGGRAPAPLVVATSLVGVEAACLVLFGVAELGALSSTKLAMGITTSLFFVSYGAGVGLVGWLLHRLRSWARAPVVLAQLLQLGVAWSFRDTAPVALVLAVVAAVVLLGVLHPASLRAVDEASVGER